MIPCHANLIAVDLDPIVLAKHFPVGKVKALLRSVEDCIFDDVIRNIWATATFQGTGFKLNVPQLIGSSMSIAPVAGIGFCTFAWLTQLPQATLEEIDAQHYAVQAIAEIAREQITPWVIPILDFISNTDYPFEVAFRRRIAYALGFRASLLVGNTAYYDTWFETLIAGEVSEVEVIGHNDDTLIEFSTVLNLLARLDGVMAYERDNGHPHVKVSCQVRDYQLKLGVLDARLNSLVRVISQDFNEDGRIALKAILYELSTQRITSIWNVLDFPQWGGTANSDVFLSDIHDLTL